MGMQGIERPRDVAHRYMKNSLTNFSFISLFCGCLIAIAALVTSEVRAEEIADTEVTTETQPIIDEVNASAPTESNEDTDSATEKTNATTPPPNVNRSDNRSDIATTRNAAVQDRRAGLSEQRQTRIINLAANISNRMDATIVRLSTIADRLTTRYDKMTAEGTNVTAARALLADASTALAAAATTLEDIDVRVTSATRSENPRSDWQAVKMQYSTAREEIKRAFSFLQQSITAAASPSDLAPEPVATEPSTN